MKKPKLVAFTTLILAGLTLSLLVEERTNRALRMENTGLRGRASELDQLREENSRLSHGQTDPAEMERLRSAQSELLRLRGEVAQLRQQLKEKTAESTRQGAVAKEAAPAPNEQPVSAVETYVATSHAAVTWQQTLVTGGWKLPSGKRAMVLIQPQSVGGGANEPGQVEIQTRIAELPEELLAQVGLDRLKSETKQSSSQAVLNSEQTEQLVNALQQTAGVDFLTAPRITTLDGRQAQVKVRNEMKSATSGETYEVGPSIDIVPHISADGASVTFSTVLLSLPMARKSIRH